jgi:hypothetical protein
LALCFNRNYAVLGKRMHAAKECMNNNQWKDSVLGGTHTPIGNTRHLPVKEFYICEKGKKVI